MPLPFLPGYALQTDVPASFAKRHQFDLINGVPVTDVVELRTLDQPISPEARFAKERPGYDGIPPDPWTKKIPKHDRRAIPMSRLPPWMAFSNKVLRFHGYFKDSVHERPEETQRVRACTLFYYLEDDSIHIQEIKDHNSGMKQGLLVKRHQIPAGPDRYYVVQDLARIGAELPIYGKTFRITDADPFTRRFLEATLGLQLGPSEPTPLDDFHARQQAAAAPGAKPDGRHASDVTKFVEAQQGKPMKSTLRRTRQFLEHDRQVLRFWVTWRDPALYGEARPFIVHYFRADSTMEVLEIKQPNSGRDAFPALLKRHRMPKAFASSNQAQIGTDESLEDDAFYSEADFRIGGTIVVFGRELLITDCDEYTRNFYKTHYGLTDDEMRAIPCQTATEEVRRQEVLQDEPSTQPEQHHIVFDASPLRFEAILDTNRPEDHERKFVVTFFKQDSTVAIFEGKVRNSGFVGGKFLERTYLPNLDSTKFFVGSTLRLNGFPFRLTGADEFTLRFMESHSDMFPAADVDVVEKKLAGAVSQVDRSALIDHAHTLSRNGQLGIYAERSGQGIRRR